LTAAVDKRVVAIAPTVMDLLNMKKVCVSFFKDRFSCDGRTLERNKDTKFINYLGLCALVLFKN